MHWHNGASRDAKCRYSVGWESEHPTISNNGTHPDRSRPSSSHRRAQAALVQPLWPGKLNMHLSIAALISNHDRPGSEGCTWSLRDDDDDHGTRDDESADRRHATRWTAQEHRSFPLCSSPWLSSRLASWPRHSFPLSSSPMPSSACPAPPSSPGMAPSLARAASATRPRACLLPIASPMTR